MQDSLSAALIEIARDLDIPPSKYRDAVNHYTAVGNWLDAQSSPLRKYRPAIHPQGSFRIGTVVRPVKRGREADYDIDLVCRLEATKAQLTAARLKHLVGDRLKEHETYRMMLDDEGRRCWTLKYAEADDIGFHLDVLPSTPEDRAYIEELVRYGVHPELAQHAIAITERSGRELHIWVEGGSNPYGFAEWFDEVNEKAMARAEPLQKQLIFEANRPIYASVQDVPDGLVRTPLQRSIQLLKRHRDVRFSGHQWEAEKPISMIITTLAARAFREDELELDESLQGILERIDNYDATGVVERRDGKWWIPNPVNPGENFADRWNDAGSHRAEAFFEWVAWVRQDLAQAEDQPTVQKRATALAESFGVSDGQAHEARKSGALVVVAKDSVPALAASTHCQSPPWPVQATMRVTVSGSVRQTQYATKEMWKLSGRPVPKNRWLRFEARTNVPGPYEVQWQVVNTGQEASSAGAQQLRGGFDGGEGTNGAVRWESTAYRGTHWIEAFVIKGGVCVARSGPVYVRVR